MNKEIELMVEWDSCESGCGTTYYYGNDITKLVDQACGELCTVCRSGDTIEATLIETEWGDAYEAFIYPTSYEIM